MKLSEATKADDERWRKDRDELGWKLPPVAAWPLRLPVIRWFRATYAIMQVERHYVTGFGSFGIRTGYDEWVIYAISRGWC
jgi:hypothetical protein